MKIERNIWAVIIVLIVIIFAQRECSRPYPVNPSGITIVVDTIYDLEIKRDSIHFPVPYLVIETVIDTVLIDVDTAAILHDYFAMRIYNDTLVDDDDLYFSISDTVHRNRLLGRSFEYQNRRPVGFDVSVDIPSPKRNFYIGGMIMGSPDHFGAGPGIAYQAKDMNLYAYQYDLINNNHHITFFWKLGR